MDDRPDPVETARRFVAVRFPDARTAFVGGSVLTPARTATSDLDVVVLLGGPPAPFRETCRFEGWLVEAFVQTDESLEYFYATDLARRQCSLARMVGLGRVVADREGSAAEVQADARRRVAAGPGPLGERERDAHRYALTDQLDDLAGCQDADELGWVAGHVATLTAQLAVAVAGHWNGAAKWLHRELTQVDADLAARLAAAQRRVAVAGDRAPLDTVAREVLDRAGGPLLEGYRLAADLPA